MKPTLKTLIIALFAAATAFAEVPRVPLFIERPNFAASAAALESFQAWVVFDHIANQDQEPLFGKSLETGVRFSLFSSPYFVVWGRVREIFQFMRNSKNPTYILVRDIVTDIALAGETIVGPFSAAFGFRHDCKHDVDGSYGRSLLHDAFFARLSLQTPLSLGYADGASVTAAAEAEANLLPVFQGGAAEVDMWRTTAEARYIPVVFSDLFRPFAEGRISVIGRRSIPDVDLEAGMYVDWRASMGIEILGAIGSLRVYVSAERLTDPWKDPSPHGVVIVSIGTGLSLDSDR